MSKAQEEWTTVGGGGKKLRNRKRKDPEVKAKKAQILKQKETEAALRMPVYKESLAAAIANQSKRHVEQPNENGRFSVVNEARLPQDAKLELSKLREKERKARELKKKAKKGKKKQGAPKKKKSAQGLQQMCKALTVSDFKELLASTLARYPEAPEAWPENVAEFFREKASLVPMVCDGEAPLSWLSSDVLTAGVKWFQMRITGALREALLCEYLMRDEVADQLMVQLMSRAWPDAMLKCVEAAALPMQATALVAAAPLRKQPVASAFAKSLVPHWSDDAWSAWIDVVPHVLQMHDFPSRGMSDSKAALAMLKRVASRQDQLQEVLFLMPPQADVVQRVIALPEHMCVQPLHRMLLHADEAVFVRLLKVAPRHLNTLIAVLELDPAANYPQPAFANFLAKLEPLIKNSSSADRFQAAVVQQQKQNSSSGGRSLLPLAAVTVVAAALGAAGYLHLQGFF